MATVEKEKYGCAPSSSDQAGASGAYSNSAIGMGDVRWHALRLSAHLRHTLDRK